MKNNTLFPGVLIVILFTLTTALSGQEVIRHPDANQPLNEKWKWAKEQASKKNMKQYWIGYSIVKLMQENSTIGTFYSDTRRNKPSLADVLAGHTSGEESSEASGSGAMNKGVTISENGKSSNRKVNKEIGILFHFNNREIIDLTISNLTLRVDLENDPLLWMDGAKDEESLELLKNLYSSTSNNDVKENIVHAIGNHQSEKLVIPFLKEVLKGMGEADVREQAAFWLGQRNTNDALTILTDVIYHDRSENVREQSIFAVSQMDDTRSIESLISFAKDKKLERDIRSKAMFWLGEKASKHAVKTLEDIADNDEDSEIQRQALFALTQNDDGGVDMVIKIAKTHHNKKLRREAIFWLGQSEDPRALETLVEIIRN